MVEFYTLARVGGMAGWTYQNLYSCDSDYTECTECTH